jgi:hypothetical protein
MANPGWIQQQLNRMAPGINAGKTRKRAVASVHSVGASETEFIDAVRNRGWRLAQVGDDYVVAPGNYVIRPLV